MTREKITNNDLIDSLNGIIAGLKDESLIALGLFVKHLEYIKEKIEKGEWSCDSDTCKENHEVCTREEILNKAKQCVCGQRQQDYGTPESNFQLIADLWNTYLYQDFKTVITPTDVAMMMALLKIARIKNGGGTGDSFVDLAGYAACGGEINSCKQIDIWDLQEEIKKPYSDGCNYCKHKIKQGTDEPCDTCVHNIESPYPYKTNNWEKKDD
jgi:hypothetical protein